MSTQSSPSPAVEPTSAEHGATAKASKRLAWTVADQVLSSGTNFALGVLVARTVSVKAFGLFTLVYATYQIALGMSRALVSEPFVVRFSRDDLLHRKDPIRDATGASFMFGCATGLVIVLASLLFTGQDRASFLILGVGMPFLLVQDAWRFMFFAAGKPRSAAVNDFIWTATQLGLIVAVSAGSTPHVSVLLAVWCFAGVVAAIAGIIQARTVPRARAAIPWLSSTKDLGVRFMAEFVIGNGTSQILLWLVTFTAGLIAAAALRAAQLLLGPPRVVITAAYSAIVPEGVRFRRTHPQAFPLAVVGCAAVLAGTSASWGLLLLVLPQSVGHALLGASWHSARPLLLVLTIGAAAFGVQTAAIVALRVLAAASRSLRARAITAPVGLVATIVGGALDGAMGAAIGLSSGQVFAAAVTWWHWKALANIDADSADLHLGTRLTTDAPSVSSGGP